MNMQTKAGWPVEVQPKKMASEWKKLPKHELVRLLVASVEMELALQHQLQDQTKYKPHYEEATALLKKHINEKQAVQELLEQAEATCDKQSKFANGLAADVSFMKDELLRLTIELSKAEGYISRIHEMECQERLEAFPTVTHPRNASDPLSVPRAYFDVGNTGQPKPFFDVGYAGTDSRPSVQTHPAMRPWHKR